MEKTLRVLGADEDAHGHSHSHSQPYVSPEVIKNSSVKGSATEDGPRSRNKTATNSISSSPEIPKTANGPSKLSAYLNLFGDFVHNMLVLKILPLSSEVLIHSFQTVQMDWREYQCDILTLHVIFFAYPGWPHRFTRPLLSVQLQLWPVSLMKFHMKLLTTQS